MKYILVKNNPILPLDGYAAIAIYPFIFVDPETPNYRYNREKLMEHEKIHLNQQLEMLIIPFYVWYVVEFTLRYLYYRDWNLAYYNISFEKEAFSNDGAPGYHKTRKRYSWIKYLRK